MISRFYSVVIVKDGYLPVSADGIELDPGQVAAGPWSLSEIKAEDGTTGAMLDPVFFLTGLNSYISIKDRVYHKYIYETIYETMQNEEGQFSLIE